MNETLNVVVPTDFSEASLAALEWVEKLSDRGHAVVHCVNVVQHPIVYMPVMSGTTLESVPAVEELQKISQKSLDSFIAQHMDGLENKPVSKVLVGRPAEEITNYAKEINAQMIVIATHGHSGLTHMMLGSTAEGVVRQADCPVLTVRCK